jgi:thiamine-phosphate pyrophosphorylase
MLRSLSKKNPLYLITDTAISGLSHIRIVLRAIDAGIGTIQLREKHLPKKEIFKAACRIRDITAKQNVTFIVNDYVDVALAVDADGVHLGQDDMPLSEARLLMGKKKIIGVSTHSMKQAAIAEKAGADYIGFGPLFATMTKAAGHPKGIRQLEKIRDHVKIPIVAIGGISRGNVWEVLNGGADYAAVASGILSGNIQKNVEKYLEAVSNAH